MSDSKPLILVTNDDGIRAEGIAALAAALDDLGEVFVFAPESQQSASSHSVSLHRPLRVHEIQDRWFMVDGTPVDCVMLAVRDLLPRPPALLVSGINNGANLGDDVTYSGTVAGAYEGMLLDIPSIAISDVEYSPRHYDTAARVSRQLAAEVLERGLPPDTVLNVNVPDLPYEELAGVSHTRMGRRHYEDEIVRRIDPRGHNYYWIGGTLPSENPEEGTDVAAIALNHVSITPLHRDVTNYESLRAFDSWTLDL
jgi:5'-nucleotidase